MLEALIFTLAGVAAGTATGLLPGLHVNTVVAVLIGLGLSLNPLWLAAFIFSVAITHTFLDFIPAVLLGVPSEDTALGVLPGHRMVLKGRGVEAIKLTLLGSFGCLLLSLALLPIFLHVIPLVFASAERWMAAVLLGCSAVLILLEKGKKKLLAAAIFIMAGLYGVVSLDLPVGEPLMPMLTGLFGLSLLLGNLKERAVLPTQVRAKLKLSWLDSLRGIFSGGLSGAIVGFLPGFGPSQAAVMSKTLLKQKDDREFLITLGGINTTNSIFSRHNYLYKGQTL